jgi:hypothetical protein
MKISNMISPSDPTLNGGLGIGNCRIGRGGIKLRPDQQRGFDEWMRTGNTSF